MESLLRLPLLESRWLLPWLELPRLLTLSMLLLLLRRARPGLRLVLLLPLPLPSADLPHLHRCLHGRRTSRRTAVLPWLGGSWERSCSCVGLNFCMIGARWGGLSAEFAAGLADARDGCLRTAGCLTSLRTGACLGALDSTAALNLDAAQANVRYL